MSHMCRFGALLSIAGYLVLPKTSAQIITTIAGSNPVIPASIAARNAPLGPLSAVAVDPAGNLYAADTGNNMIVKVSPDGALTVVAGNDSPGFSGDGGPAVRASLNRLRVSPLIPQVTFILPTVPLRTSGAAG